MTARGAREGLEDAVRAAVAEAGKCRSPVRPCESCGRNVAEILAAAEALVADEVLKAADVTLGRARAAEDELAAETKRRERAEGKAAQAREGIGNFLEQYGKSEIPMFKVAVDLANSLRKVLGDGGEPPRA
jgi:hypothetical protein